MRAENVFSKSPKIMPQTSQRPENTFQNLSKCLQIGSHWTHKLRFQNPQTLSNDVRQETQTENSLDSELMKLARWRVMRAAHWIHIRGHPRVLCFVHFSKFESQFCFAIPATAHCAIHEIELTEQSRERMATAETARDDRRP